jgi:hypothetical protein
MTTSPAHPGAGWRTGVARRLQQLAGALDHEMAPVHGRTVEPHPGESPEDFVARRLRCVVEELYPTVAKRVLALAEQGAAADLDDWVSVARLLYDQHMHRVGGPSVEARQQALLATLAPALEAQARSSARLAGYAEHELDLPSPVDGDPPGTLLWEHYLCPQARLARSALHGEAVGDWLGALGELWHATDALYERAAAEAGDEDDDAGTLERVKVALVRVQELSLW